MVLAVMGLNTLERFVSLLLPNRKKSLFRVPHTVEKKNSEEVIIPKNLDLVGMRGQMSISL